MLPLPRPTRQRPPERPRPWPRRARLLLLAALALTGAAGAAVAQWQRGGGGARGGRGVWVEENTRYDGRFAFVRLRYPVYRRSGWEFDYPAMERNLMTITRELTSLRPHLAGSNVHDMDDPELLRHPVAYLSEPGYWEPTDAEVAGLRTYLRKGGFLIVDDFMRGEWTNFETQMLRVLPGARIVKLDVSHPIFDSFFRIPSLDMTYPGNPNLQAQFLGIHEDDDPTKRLMVVINYNNDIGDYMEWSGEGWWPVDLTNDAYKLAVNYLVYGMTR